MFLERNLEQLTRVHQQLVNQNNELRLEKKVSEKKLAARNERIRGLEVLLSSAQEKLQQQSEKYATHDTHTHDTTHDTHYTLACEQLC
jgi:predicted nuclease with TOPRIM domain